VGRVPGEEVGRLRVVDPISTAIENHPAGKGVSERDAALLEAEKWSNRVDIAREAYGEALAKCKELGIPNVRIARAVGKTEAAVRMYLKRKRK
jgi:hypothetical protein